MIDLSLGHIRLPSQREGQTVCSQAEYGDPAGLPELRELLAARHHVAESSIAVTTGSSLAITCALASRRPPVVLLPRPYYPAFPRIAALLGIDCEYYPAVDATGSVDVAAVVRLIGKNPGCTILWNYPHNPTGVIDRPADREEVLAAVATSSSEVIHDLVYSDLVYDDDYVLHQGDPAPQEIRAFSLSKAHALAGERIGYVIAAEERRHEIERAHWAMAMSPPAASQAFAYGAVREHLYGDERLRDRLLGLRDFACARLSAVPELVVHTPSGGIFVWVEAPALAVSGDYVTEACRRAGVLVTSGSAFGVTDRATVRLSFAVDRETLDRGLDLFLAIVGRIHARTLPASSTDG